MKTACCFIVLFLSTYGFGQQDYFGFTIGASRAQTVRANFEFYTPISGFTFAGIVERHKKNFYVKSAANFAQRGHTQSLIYVDANNTVLGEGAIERTRHSYAGLSGLVGAVLGNQLFGFVGTGLTGYGYLGTVVQGDQFVLNDGEIVEAYRNYKDVLQAFDLAWTTELGFGFQGKKGSAILVRSHYDFGILNVHYKTQLSENGWKNRVLSFELGFRMKINEVEPNEE